MGLKPTCMFLIRDCLTFCYSVSFFYYWYCLFFYSGIRCTDNFLFLILCLVVWKLLPLLFLLATQIFNTLIHLYYLKCCAFVHLTKVCVSFRDQRSPTANFYCYCSVSPSLTNHISCYYSYLKYYQIFKLNYDFQRFFVNNFRLYSSQYLNQDFLSHFFPSSASWRLTADHEASTIGLPLSPAAPEEFCSQNFPTLPSYLGEATKFSLVYSYIAEIYPWVMLSDGTEMTWVFTNLKIS